MEPLCPCVGMILHQDVYVKSPKIIVQSTKVKDYLMALLIMAITKSLNSIEESSSIKK